MSFSRALFKDAHARFFGPNPNLPHIFGTEAGGRQLCDFIHVTQVLLCPLLDPTPHECVMGLAPDPRLCLYLDRSHPTCFETLLTLLLSIPH